MKKIKKVGVLSLGKIMGLIYAILGLVFGCFFTFFSMVGMVLSQSSEGFMPLLFGIGAIFFMPILYGLGGFLFGMLGAVLYNWVAGWIGGIEIELG